MRKARTKERWTWGRDSIASLWKVGVTAHHKVNTFLTWLKTLFKRLKFELIIISYKPCETAEQQWELLKQQHIRALSPPAKQLQWIQYILTQGNNTMCTLLRRVEPYVKKNHNAYIGIGAFGASSTRLLGIIYKILYTIHRHIWRLIILDVSSDSSLGLLYISHH